MTRHEMGLRAMKDTRYLKADLRFSSGEHEVWALARLRLVLQPCALEEAIDEESLLSLLLVRGFRQDCLPVV